MAGSFVKADKTSQDVRQWVRLDQTWLTAAILNLALNSRNAMPMRGRTRLVALETREREKKSRCEGGPDDARFDRGRSPP
jgi:hypothetical protein